MKKQIKELTLSDIHEIDNFYYWTQDKGTYKFNDLQFQEFLFDQIASGFDDIELQLDLDDGNCIYSADCPANAIYFFENLAEKGEWQDWVMFD